MADAAPKDAGDFLKQLGQRVVQDLPKTAEAAAANATPTVVLETRSPLLSRVELHPFHPAKAPGQGAAPGPGTTPTSAPYSVGADLKPKVTVLGADGKSVVASYAPYGEPGEPHFGRFEAELFGGLLVGLGTAFGLGWLFGARRKRK